MIMDDFLNYKDVYVRIKRFRTIELHKMCSKRFQYVMSQMSNSAVIMMIMDD